MWIDIKMPIFAGKKNKFGCHCALSVHNFSFTVLAYSVVLAIFCEWLCLNPIKFDLKFALKLRQRLGNPEKGSYDPIIAKHHFKRIDSLRVWAFHCSIICSTHCCLFVVFYYFSLVRWTYCLLVVNKKLRTF